MLGQKSDLILGQRLDQKSGLGFKVRGSRSDQRSARVEGRSELKSEFRGQRI